MRGAKYRDKKLKQSSKWFRRLYFLDRDAYQFIKKNYPKAKHRPSLDVAFIWNNTPQGFGYWQWLNTQIITAEWKETEAAKARQQRLQKPSVATCTLQVRWK